MKALQTLLVALLLAGVSAQAAVNSGTFGSGDVNLGIVDGNPAALTTSSINVSGLTWITTSVNVTVNVTGGFNGDLYAYLSYNGTTVTLLNRVGTGTGTEPTTTWGFSTAGFSNVRLSDAGAGGAIHGTLSPEAYSVNGTSYTPDSGSSSLAAFNGSNPNGAWTISFADMAGGGGSSSSTLVSWSLDVTAVPEPVNVALGIFAGLGLVVGACRSRFWKRPSQI